MTSERPSGQSFGDFQSYGPLGLLIAAFYNPVWKTAILGKGDFALAAVAFLLLMMWRTPPWLVVLICAAGGQFLAALP